VLPLFIQLRDFAAAVTTLGRGYSLLDHVYDHAHQHLLLNLRTGLFEDALESGRCVVCLDGLDEVWAVGQRRFVRDAVTALVAKFPYARYIVTSRSVGYDEAPLDRREFDHYSILPLDDAQIREFVQKWYQLREREPIQRKQRVEDIADTIEREPRIKSLARYPLLLTIIVLVHRIEAQLPHERVKLYDKCVATLVGTWEEAKELSTEERRRDLYRHMQRLMERLAYELHTRAETRGQAQTVRKGDLEILIARFLMEIPSLGLADDPDAARDEARAFVDWARRRTGLLVERGEEVFGFPHPTFQEYLAACDIEHRCMHRGMDAIWDEVKDVVLDPHWREVVLLLLGRLSNYDEAPTLLVGRILEGGEADSVERVVHRRLYLAAGALADKVELASDLMHDIVSQLLVIARSRVNIYEVSPAGTQPEVGTRVRGEAGDALTALALLDRNRCASEGLLWLAQDPEVGDFVRCNAAGILERLGHSEEAAGILLGLARDPKVDEYVRHSTAQALARLGYREEAREVLLGLARNPEGIPAVRRSATRALARLGPAQRVLEGLQDLAQAQDPYVSHYARRGVTEVLIELGDSEEAADMLLGLARDTKVVSIPRESAAEALAELGPSQRVLEGLQDLAQAQDPEVSDSVRRSAAEALARLGHSEEAAGILLGLARDPKVEGYVRRRAAEALTNLGHSEEAAEVFLGLAQYPKVVIGHRVGAAEALARLGHSEEAAGILLGLARDPEVDSLGHIKAGEALRRLGRSEEAVEILLGSVQDSKQHALDRYFYARALGELGRTEEAVGILLGLARDPETHADERYDATEALARLGHSEEAAEILLGLTRDLEGREFVRHSYAEALGELGRTEEAVEILLGLARDPAEEMRVRVVAYESLKRLVGSGFAPP
jgi:tetratricopeptide (TPR) repeat protein